MGEDLSAIRSWTPQELADFNYSQGAFKNPTVLSRNTSFLQSCNPQVIDYLQDRSLATYTIMGAFINLGFMGLYGPCILFLVSNLLLEETKIF
jgi:hypothetical protein